MYGTCRTKEQKVFTIETSESETNKEEKTERTPFLLTSSFLPTTMATVSLTMRKDEANKNTIITMKFFYQIIYYINIIIFFYFQTHR